MTGEKQFFYSLDHRSLSLFRVLFGLCLLIDLVGRLQNFSYFYSSNGIISIRLWNAIWGSKPIWSVHLVISDFILLFILIIQLILALLIIIGLKVRLACFISFILFLSLVFRNPLLHYGGDKLIPLVLFCMVFLPFTNNSNTLNTNKRINSAAGFLLTLQISILYFVSGASKLHFEYWKDGSAFSLVFSMNNLVKPFASIFNNYDIFLNVLSLSAPWLEILFALMLVVPTFFLNGRIRLLGILGLLTVNLFIYLTIDVGYFMHYTSSALCALIPSQSWEWVERRSFYVNFFSRLFSLRSKRSNSILQQSSELPSENSYTFYFETIIPKFIALYACFIIFTAFESLRFWEPYNYPRPIWNCIMGLNIYQNWGLFNSLPSKQHWFVAKSKLNNGIWVDALQGGEPVSWKKPNSPNKLFLENSKWRLIFAKSYLYPDSKELQIGILNSIANKWNNEHPPEQQIVSITLYKVEEANDASGSKVTWRKWPSWHK